MEVNRCPECGKPRGFLMQEHDVDVWVKITGSPALLIALCVLGVLAIVGFEAMVR